MKQMTNTQKAMLAGLAALLLSGCGSSKQDSGSSDLSSRATPTQVASGTQAWAYCNEGIAKQGTFKFSMKNYVENGQSRNDLMYLKLTTMPSNFTSSSDYIQFYRWQVNPSGAVNFDNTPLQFRVYNPATGAIIISNASYLRWSDVSTVASQMGLSDPTQFFKKVNFIIDVRDQLGQFDVIRTVIYNSSNAEKDRSDALLPIFSADPAAYAIEPDGQPRAQMLRNLHPFQSQASQGWSVKDFQVWANGFCTPFN